MDNIRILKEKIILIISPQPWSDMKVSKHHYAIELIQNSNTVYFLNPNSPGVKRGTCKLSLITPEGVYVLDYRPLFPMRYKFLLNKLFNLFIRWDVAQILRAIGKKPDIVWDFEPNRQFNNLNFFKSKIKIYHPVDVTKFINGKTKNADIIFTVSELLLSLFKDSKTPTYFINHGLSSTFAKRTGFFVSHIKKEERINAGYIGNLRMAPIDRCAFKQIIKSHPEITFHIWGPYKDDSDLHNPLRKEINCFIKFLLDSRNVILYGLMPADRILESIENIDIFFWCFDNRKDPNKGANSHKILEYLSTGKVIVSSQISTYNTIDNRDLIVMSSDKHKFEDCFYEVANNLNYYNCLELRKKRIDLALGNTYNLHIGTIDKYLFNLKSQKFL